MVWWIWPLLAVVAVGLVVGGYRWRLANIEARNRELAVEVGLRTLEIAERTADDEALYQADEQLVRSLRLDEVLQALVDIAVDVLGASKSAVLCWDETRARLVARAARGFSPPSTVEFAIQLEQDASCGVMATGEPVIVADTIGPDTIGPDTIAPDTIAPDTIGSHTTGSNTTRPAAAHDPQGIATTVAASAEGIRSFMHLPLRLEHEIFGIFHVSYGQPRGFGEREQRLFTALAQRAAIAVERARYFEAERRRAEQFRLIAEVGHAVAALLDANEALAQIARLVQAAFGYYQVSIGLVEGDEVVSRVCAGAPEADPDDQCRPPRQKIGEETPAGKVVVTGQPLLVPDLGGEGSYAAPPGSRARSLAIVPVSNKGQAIGVLEAQSDRPGAFDESDLAVLETLANQAAVAIENARLYESAQELAAMRERSRLARDLHDAVTQTLFAASLIGDVLPETWETDTAQGRALLHDLRQLTRGALAEMRTLLLELRPAALVETQLPDLLRQLAEAAAGRTGVTVPVTVEGDSDLPQEVRVSLYRIAQEALNNVVKHARARQVTVSLRSVPGEQTVLVIGDDGCGFDPNRLPPERMGLSMMGERAQTIGARLAIDSAPGRGTQVRVRWPEEETVTGGADA